MRGSRTEGTADRPRRSLSVPWTWKAGLRRWSGIWRTVRNVPGRRVSIRPTLPVTTGLRGGRGRSPPGRFRRAGRRRRRCGCLPGHGIGRLRRRRSGNASGTSVRCGGSAADCSRRRPAGALPRTNCPGTRTGGGEPGRRLRPCRTSVPCRRATGRRRSGISAIRSRPPPAGSGAGRTSTPGLRLRNGNGRPLPRGPPLPAACGRQNAGPPANRVAAKARELRTGLDRDWDVRHLERDIARHRSGAVRAGTDPFAAAGADGLAARAEALEALRPRPGEASYRIRDFVDGHREHAVRRREFAELLAAVRRCVRERDRLLAKAGNRDLPFRTLPRTRPGLWRWHRQAAAAACRRLLAAPERYGAFLDVVPDGYGLVRRTLDTVGRARELDNLPAGLLRRLRNNAAEADAAGFDPRVTDAYPGIVGELERPASPRLVSRAETRSVAEGLVRDYGPAPDAPDLRSGRPECTTTARPVAQRSEFPRMQFSSPAPAESRVAHMLSAGD